MFLKSDVELLYDTSATVTDPGPSGLHNCTTFNSFSSCVKQTETYDTFMSYVSNTTGNSAFFGNFSTAYAKMTSLRASNLVSLITGSFGSQNASVPAPTAPTPVSMTPSSQPSSAPSKKPTASPSSTRSPTTRPSNGPSTNVTARSPPLVSGSSSLSTSFPFVIALVAGFVIYL